MVRRGRIAGSLMEKERATQMPFGVYDASLGQNQF